VKNEKGKMENGEWRRKKEEGKSFQFFIHNFAFFIL